MKGTVTTGLLALALSVGLSFQPVMANPPDYGSKGHGEGGYGGGGHGGGFGMGMGMPGHHTSTGHLLRGLLRSEKELGLTEDQVSKLKSIQLELDKTRIKTEADIMIGEREVASLTEDNKSDLGAIESKLKANASQEVALRLAAIKARRDAMAVLTPEQSERVKMIHEKMKAGMAERMGKHGDYKDKDGGKKDMDKK